MEISLSEILDIAIDRKMENVHTSLPGVIESYDHATQKASVKALINKKYADGEDGEQPVIVNVPVVFPSGSDSGIFFPIKGGESCLLHFSERSMENFLALDGEQEPGDPRKFDMTDCICVPGLNSFAKDSFTENAEDVLLLHKETKIRLKPDGDMEIEVEKDCIIKIKGDKELEIEGDFDVTISGNASLDISGNLEINAAGIEINSDITLNGNLNVDGSVVASDEVTASGIDLSSHTHGGVDPGPGDTGPPN